MRMTDKEYLLRDLRNAEACVRMYQEKESSGFIGADDFDCLEYEKGRLRDIQRRCVEEGYGYFLAGEFRLIPTRQQ